ncbi:MAG TPA: TIGR03032 family protein [Gemmataceae bacterium]|nr:TIGR03032 family protein [Gemmataceae bacterium]
MKTSNEQAAPAPLRSVHTSNFPELLDQIGISLVVTTYQAGKVVLLRADGGLLNTHFRDLPAPMGVALRGNRLAIGGPWSIWEFHNVPAVARKIEPVGRHDACFLPRLLHVTGNVQIHEMAWVGDELWFVNTRFSCLCTRDLEHSFVPRWRPPFITALAPEDRCHLNGLGLVDGQPRYVTALGLTDTAGGWRENKKDGGLLLGLPAGEVVTRGLSMPHSPRWYDNRLWLLESGQGGLGVVDLPSGKYEAVAQLPGFTRGLDFHGPLAFVGLSQVRETAVFSGIPITEPARERNCGVWVVDLRSGQTIAFVRFEDQLQEIFGVQVLPGIRYPELLSDGQHEFVADSFVLPDEALRDALPELRR